MMPGPGGLAPGNSASLRLPGEHFAASLLFLLAGVIGIVSIAPDLAAGNFMSIRVVGVTHLFTLGWLTTTIFGALYQLLPVALGAPVRSEMAGHMSFWCHAPGVAVFVTGIITNSEALHDAGISLIALGIVLLVINVGLTLPRSTNSDETWWSVVGALFFLVFTLLLGVLLVTNYHTGFLLDRRIATLAVHIHVALVGWVFMMVIGMSHRLLPMFLLAHGANTSWTKRALLFLPAGLPLFAIGMLYDLPLTAWMGVLLIELGVVSFVLQARAFAVARKRPRLDVGLRFAGVALVFLIVGAVLAPVVLGLGGVVRPGLATVYMLFTLVGGLSMYVVGMYYKVVPFLAWIARFRGRIGREKVPTVAELYWARVAETQLFLMTCSVLILAAGIAAGNTLIVRAGSVLLLAGVLLFVSQIIRVMTVGRKAVPVTPKP